MHLDETRCATGLLLLMNPARPQGLVVVRARQTGEGIETVHLKDSLVLLSEG